MQTQKRISRGSHVWTHHPRGGFIVGYAGPSRHSEFGWRERGIARTREEAKLGQCFTYVPSNQLETVPDINRILARPEYKGCSQYGAQMGRRSQCQGSPELLHLQRVRFVSGDYDTGGAYWGGGRDSLPLYCAFSRKATADDEPIMVFVRAANREEAKQLVLDQLPEEGFMFLE